MGKGIAISVCYVRKVDFKIHVVSASVACSSSYSYFFIKKILILYADFI